MEVLDERRYAHWSMLDDQALQLSRFGESIDPRIPKLEARVRELEAALFWAIRGAQHVEPEAGPCWMCEARRLFNLPAEVGMPAYIEPNEETR